MDFSSFTRTIFETENKISAASAPLEKSERRPFEMFISFCDLSHNLNNKAHMMFITHFDVRDIDLNPKKTIPCIMPDSIEAPKSNKQLESILYFYILLLALLN